MAEKIPDAMDAKYRRTAPERFATARGAGYDSRHV
jgi:hypothetical protein